MQTTKTRRLISLLMALALIAAACGGNDDSDAGSGEPAASATKAPAEPAEPEPEETATAEAKPEETATAEAKPAEPEPEETAPAFEPAPTAEPEPEIELTATWRGVTADTITVGVSYLDFEALMDMNLSPYTWGDQELVIRALADDINERGAINGRRLEVIIDKYNPVGVTEAEAACLRMTEDNEVFAVLFGFLGPAELANNCIVGNQETILVGGTITDERMAEARAPWVNDRAPRKHVTSALFTLLAEEGMLEGRSIAVVADVVAAPQLGEVTGIMRDHGIEPVLEIATSSPVGDIVAQSQEWGPLSERIRLTGADTLLLVGNASAGIQNADLNGLEMDIWTTDASGLGSNIGNNVDPESARGVISVSNMTNGQVYETDPRFKECLNAVNERHPDIEIKHPDTLEVEEDQWFSAVFSHCRFFQIFEYLATEAGPILTHETFAEAIANAGDFSVASQPYASFGPGKYFSNDSFQLVAQDPDLGARGQLVPIGPLRDTTP